MGLNVPAGHLLGDREPGGQKCPIGHGPRTDEEKAGVDDAAPPCEKYPPATTELGEVRPGTVQAAPALQGWQSPSDLAPVLFRKVPKGHGMAEDSVLFAGQKLPSGQGTGGASVPWHVKPAGHNGQVSVRPAVALCLPGGHGFGTRVASLHVKPTGHGSSARIVPAGHQYPGGHGTLDTGIAC